MGYVCRALWDKGILKEDIEGTIRAIGRLGKIGMRETDKEILDIMLEA